MKHHICRVPNVSESFKVLTYCSHQGNFANINGLDLGNSHSLQADYEAVDLLFSVV